MSIRCVCINDSNKPVEIPPKKWIKKDKEYHITHIYYHYQQKKSGFELSEIFLDDSCFPYVSFDSNRFAIPQEEAEKLFQMLKDCTELTDIDIKKLIEEEYLETI